MKANFCRVSQSWSAISNEHLVTVVTARVSLGIPVSHGVVLGHYRGYTVYIYIYFFLSHLTELHKGLWKGGGVTERDYMPEVLPPLLVCVSVPSLPCG